MRTPTLLLALVVGFAVGAPAVAQDEPAAADAAAEPTMELLYLGLNEQGAEEWYRLADRAIVVRVPGGAYQQRPYEGMGTTAEPSPVEVESYFVDKFEVTNRQFAAFLNLQDDPTGLLDTRVAGVERRDGTWVASMGLEEHPVTAATGRGAVRFAAWVGGALPNRGQWEKAAGGADGNVFPWGDAAADASRANFGRSGTKGPMAVGSHAAGASPYGCHDMAGNVYERVNMPGRRSRDGQPMPVMIKGGSWLSPHPLNLRVLDMCVQPMQVAERSVGFRCVMVDNEPDRPSRTAAEQPKLRLATDWDAAVAEAKKRRVPLFLSLLFDTCGQCDRTRAQCYTDPRFIAYANAKLVMVVGHVPGDAMDDPHPPGAEDACPLYPGLTCSQHEALYGKGLGVVGGFGVSPGNFVLHPDKIKPDAGRRALLAPEETLPKWGNAVDRYLAVFAECVQAIRDGDGSEGD